MRLFLGPATGYSWAGIEQSEVWSHLVASIELARQIESGLAWPKQAGRLHGPLGRRRAAAAAAVVLAAVGVGAAVSGAAGAGRGRASGGCDQVAAEQSNRGQQGHAVLQAAAAGAQWQAQPRNASKGHGAHS